MPSSDDEQLPCQDGEHLPAFSMMIFNQERLVACLIAIEATIVPSAIEIPVIKTMATRSHAPTATGPGRNGPSSFRSGYPGRLAAKFTYFSAPCLTLPRCNHVCMDICK